MQVYDVMDKIKFDFTANRLRIVCTAIDLMGCKCKYELLI